MREFIPHLGLLGTGLAILGDQIVQAAVWWWAHPTTMLALAGTLNNYFGGEIAALPKNATSAFVTIAAGITVIALAWRLGAAIND